MSTPARPLAVVMASALAAVAAAIVYSPLVAAVAGAGLDRHVAVDALRHAGRPLAGSAGAAAIAAVVAVLAGLPFAIVVDRAGVVVRRAAWGLAAAALIVPPYIVAESAIVLLGPTGKVSRGFALLAGWGPPASDRVGRARYAVPGWVYTTPAAGLLVGGCLFPIVAVAVSGASRRIDHRVFEAARLMRGRIGVASVVAHALVPPALGAGLLAFALALTESVVPQLLRVPSMGEAIYERIQEGDLPTAAALGFPLLPAIVLAGSVGAFILVRARSASVAGLEGEVPTFAGGRGGLAANAIGVAATATAIAPAIVLPAVSLTWLALSADRPASAGGEHRVLRASGFVEAFRGACGLAGGDAMRTAVLAILTATLAVALSIGIVWPAVRSRRAWMTGALGAGLAVPAPVVGLGLITIWNRGDGAIIYQSPAVVVLAWLARFLPVAVLLVQVALVRVPPEILEAASLAGRGPLRRFMSVVLPSAAPGLAAAWVATYVLCATECVATLLVAPPGAPMLAPSVVNLIRRGQDPEIAAVQMLLMIVVAAPVLTMALVALLRRWGSR